VGAGPYSSELSGFGRVALRAHGRDISERTTTDEKPVLSIDIVKDAWARPCISSGTSPRSNDSEAALNSMLCKRKRRNTSDGRYRNIFTCEKSIFERKIFSALDACMIS